MHHHKDQKPSFKSKEWIKNKKDRQRRQVIFMRIFKSNLGFLG